MYSVLFLESSQYSHGSRAKTVIYWHQKSLLSFAYYALPHLSSQFLLVYCHYTYSIFELQKKTLQIHKQHNDGRAQKEPPSYWNSSFINYFFEVNDLWKSRLRRCHFYRLVSFLGLICLPPPSHCSTFPQPPSELLIGHTCACCHLWSTAAQTQLPATSSSCQMYTLAESWLGQLESVLGRWTAPEDCTHTIESWI